MINIQHIIHGDYKGKNEQERQEKRTQLLQEVSYIGKSLSAIEVTKTFCPEHVNNPGRTIVLEHALTDSGYTMGHYKHDVEGVLQKLAEAGRVIIPQDIRSAIIAVSTVQPNQAVILPHEFGRTPTFPDMSTQFLKRENVLTVRRKKRKDRLDKRIQEEIRQVKFTDELAGLDFFSNKHTSPYEVLALVDVVRGIIYNAAIHTGIRANAYMGNEPLRTGAKGGVMNIPSFSSKQTYLYHLGFEGLPVYQGTRTDLAHEGGFNIRLLGTVPREIWDSVKFRRKSAGPKDYREGSEQKWDHHAVFGLKRLEKPIEEEGYRLLLPIPEPTAETIQFYWKLCFHTLLQEPDDSAKCGYKLTHVNIGQKERLFWKRIGLINDSSY